MLCRAGCQGTSVAFGLQGGEGGAGGTGGATLPMQAEPALTYSVDAAMCFTTTNFPLSGVISMVAEVEGAPDAVVEVATAP